jgi:hypothetical protein
VYKGSFFPATSSTFGVGGIFDVSYFNRSEVESECGFDLHSFMARDGEHCLMSF